ncbi:MAG: mechanosensitive ion channel family protein [Clostridiaceae bacterium]|nr:mechanosensitive ion channel family protein [Clostridiaceae bacterium]
MELDFANMSFEDFIIQLSSFFSLNTLLVRLILALGVFFAGLLLRHLFVKVILRFFLYLTKKTKTSFDELLVEALEKPAKTLLLGLIVYLSLMILLPVLIVQKFLNFSLRLFVLVVIFWFIYRASDVFVNFIEHLANKSEKKISPAVINLLGKTLKALIIIFEVFSVIALFGYDVSGIVAGLGIGGLAISLAAKDAAANFLGSITVMVDKTYNVGDWIETSSAEGIVEEIGFRSTKIRTFTNAVTSIPNSIMSNEPITNWSRMGRRRVRYNLYIPIDTPAEKVRILLSRIKDLIDNNEDVNHEAIKVANMNGFEEGNISILIQYFTKTTSFFTYTQVNEKIYLDILQIFNELNIPISAPIKRIYLESRQNLQDMQNKEVKPEEIEN